MHLARLAHIQPARVHGTISTDGAGVHPTPPRALRSVADMGRNQIPTHTLLEGKFAYRTA